MRMGTCYRSLVCRKLDLPLSGKRVLDVGGYDGSMLSCISAVEKWLIDPDALEKYPDITYIKEDFIGHDFKEEKFERIYALDVIEHIKEDGKFMEKIISLLSDGGIALLSTPCEHIKIFPSFLQSWVNRHWKHIYRRGYNEEMINRLIGNADVKSNIIYWNCPVFRFLYLPLSFLWRISPALISEVLKLTISIDFLFKNGRKGFMFIVIKKESI